MGYRATQTRLTRTVALKLVTPALARDPSFRERFRREWMIAASIDHPNVPERNDRRIHGYKFTDVLRQRGVLSIGGRGRRH